MVSLPVHLKDEQTVVFEEDHPEQAVQNGPKQTKLLAFFDLNSHNDPAIRELANSLLYHDIPTHFRFVKGEWKKRARPVADKVVSAWTRPKPVIGRMHKAPVKDQELYALLTLLLHVRVKGAVGYDDLKTVDIETTQEDGTVVTEHRA